MVVAVAAGTELSLELEGAAIAPVLELTVAIQDEYNDRS